MNGKGFATSVLGVASYFLVSVQDCIVAYRQADLLLVLILRSHGVRHTKCCQTSWDLFEERVAPLARLRPIRPLQDTDSASNGAGAMPY